MASPHEKKKLCKKNKEKNCNMLIDNMPNLFGLNKRVLLRSKNYNNKQNCSLDPFSAINKFYGSFKNSSFSQTLNSNSTSVFEENRKSNVSLELPKSKAVKRKFSKLVRRKTPFRKVISTNKFEIRDQENDLPVVGSCPQPHETPIDQANYEPEVLEGEHSETEFNQMEEIIGSKLSAFLDQIESTIQRKLNELQNNKVSPIILGKDLDTYIKVMIGDQKSVVFENMDSRFIKDAQCYIDGILSDMHTLSVSLDNFQGDMETEQKLNCCLIKFMKRQNSKLCKFKRKLIQSSAQRETSAIMNYSSLLDEPEIDEEVKGCILDKLIRNLIKVINSLNAEFYGAPGLYIDKTLQEANLVINIFNDETALSSINEELNFVLDAFIRDINNLKQSVAGYDPRNRTAINDIMRDGINHLYNYIPRFYKIKTKNCNIVSKQRSLEASWQRYYGLKEIENPHTKQWLIKDELFSGFTWVLNMSEQFYYDNSVTSVINSMEDEDTLVNTIQMSYIEPSIEFLSREWVNVAKLGVAQYGNVFRVQEQSTGRYLTVKTWKEENAVDILSNYRFIIDYLNERNYLIKARQSPYIIQFINSLNVPFIDGFVLVTEWYICDISRLMKIMREDIKDKDIAMELWRNTPNLISDNISRTSNRIGVDLNKTIIVYVFEMFCALDYLAKVNLIHMNINPENIMIAQNLHIKLGDFGLGYNMRLITAQSETLILNHNDLPQVTNINETLQMGGLPEYKDPEMMLYNLMNRPQLLDFLFNHSDRRCDYMISGGMNFMSDLWAMGLVASMLLLSGHHLFDVRSPQFIQEAGIPVYDSFEFKAYYLFFIQTNYKRYIRDGLWAACDTNFKSLAEFLISIFSVRSARAHKFTSIKNVRITEEMYTFSHIDITKVENIAKFQEMNLKSYNSFSHILPSELYEVLFRDTPIIYGNFGEYLNSVRNKKSGK